MCNQAEILIIGVAGGGAGGALAPPGKISWLGRTKMGSWQDRNGSLAGQKWVLGRTEMEMISSETPHFEFFSVIFVYFLPLLVDFCHTFLFFFHFCLFLEPFTCHIFLVAKQFGRVA